MFYVLLIDLFIVHKFACVPRVALSAKTRTGNIVLCELHPGSVSSLQVAEKAVQTKFYLCRKDGALPCC